MHATRTRSLNRDRHVCCEGFGQLHACGLVNLGGQGPLSTPEKHEAGLWRPRHLNHVRTCPGIRISLTLERRSPGPIPGCLEEVSKNSSDPGAKESEESSLQDFFGLLGPRSPSTFPRPFRDFFGVWAHPPPRSGRSQPLQKPQ